MKILKLSDYTNKSGKKKLLSDIMKISREYEISGEKNNLKNTGRYYTDIELTEIMMNDLVHEIKTCRKEPLYELTFLEPCVGIGNYVIGYLLAVSKEGFSKKQYVKLINNIYVVDIDSNAIEIFNNILSIFTKVYFDIEIDDTFFNNNVFDNGLLFNINDVSPTLIKLEDRIKNIKFDIVATNPPYKNLRAEKNSYSSKKELHSIKDRFSIISSITKENFMYSCYGSLNMYKLFVEEIVENYTKNDSIISLLIPSSILTDKTTERLRTRLLESTSIVSIKMFDENCKYINAKQSLTAMLINKNNERQDYITIYNDYIKNSNRPYSVKKIKIMNENLGNSIFSVSDDEYKILEKLKKFKVIKDIDFIINSRGELDLTLHKNNITNTKSKYKLLKGKNIDYYSIKNKNEIQFVKESFVENSNKKEFIHSDRLICQQVVNMKKQRRLTFTAVHPDIVLGNSCNFIYVEKNIYGIDLYSLLGILNSNLLNWYFKLISSNNHVNNYEIDSFPIPLNSIHLSKISELVKEYIKTKDNKLIALIDNYVLKSYEIDDTNTHRNNLNNEIFKKYIIDLKSISKKFICNLENIITTDNELKKYLFDNNYELDEETHNLVLEIGKKYMKLNSNSILNHTTFKLSDLDLEMIVNIPPGGNWKFIPPKTVKKSKRLMRICETGGRTTLYGRIDYNKPSYTITTYFNRPGNGTYVHPVHNRVLSVREAARLQSFPDDYFFKGNKSQMLKQVGNAVPPLFAYQIAKSILSRINCKKSLDLFCGAGGMTLGFKEAGINSMLSTDIEKTACMTLKINSPETYTLVGDITELNTKTKIIEYAINKNVDIVCGGPPCQGFSMAGYRKDDDPRNKLFKDFVDIVKSVNPKVVVFENVEGILTYKNGETYKEILELFSILGYNAHGKSLYAHNYGVPQKRKRVIIICVRNDINVLAESLFPKPIVNIDEEYTTVYDAIYDLQDVECSEDVIYKSDFNSPYLHFLKREISFNDYLKVKKTIYIDQTQKSN